MAEDAAAAVSASVRWAAVVAATGLVAWGWRSWRARCVDPARWLGQVLRRGSHAGRAALLVDVRPGQESAALELAGQLAAAGLRMTCFVGADDGFLAARLAALGHEVAWLGLPTARRVDASALPSGVVVRGAPPLRVRYWRPRGARPTSAELEFSRILGFRLVAPTLTLGVGAEPDGQSLVATEVVRIAVGMTAARVLCWRSDADRRAIELVPVSEVG